MKTIFWITLLLAFYTYFGYGLLLYILVKIKEFIYPKRQISTIEPLENYPSVCLFIAAYNEQDIVDAKMQNCNSLNYPKDKLNILWITDGSNDNTNNLLEKYKNVKVYYQAKRMGKAAAFNRGIEFVSDDIVIFTDANTMLCTNAIREIVLAFKDKMVACVAGEKRVQSDKIAGAVAGEGLYWKYESKLKELDSRLYSTVGAAGELFAIRKQHFVPLSHDTLLDDFILSLSIAMKGYKIAYCKQAYALESPSANMKEENKRKVRIAAGGLQSIYRLRPLLNIFKYKTLSFQYISHRVLRWTITPIALILLFISNTAIVVNKPDIFYLIFLFLQTVFYLCALVGYYLASKNIKNKILYVPFYFTIMNINVLRGFSYLRKNKGKGTWERAKRS